MEPNVRLNHFTMFRSRKMRKKPIITIDDSLMNDEILLTGITRDNYLIYWSGGAWHVDIVKLEPKEPDDDWVLDENQMWEREKLYKSFGSKEDMLRDIDG